MLSSENNFNLLVNKILETFNSSLYDTSDLRIAEKELKRVETSLSNLIAAVENGFFSETTNERLKELESRKAELKETIAKERVKEITPLTQKQVVDYLTYAITQPSQNLINLLVRKVIVRENAVDVYLKYTSDNPNDDKPKQKRPAYNKNPERNLSEQGFLFMSYTYSYIQGTQGRKRKLTEPKIGLTRHIQVSIFI